MDWLYTRLLGRSSLDKLSPDGAVQRTIDTFRDPIAARKEGQG
jgi:hypothetical protein